MLSILYYLFLDRTTLSAWTKHASSLVLFVGIAAQTGGFLLHAITGQPGQAFGRDRCHRLRSSAHCTGVDGSRIWIDTSPASDH
jgi:hypothetical protein